MCQVKFQLASEQLMLTEIIVLITDHYAFQCRDYIRDGALRGNSPCEVVQSCDITLSCVSDPSALKDVSMLISSYLLLRH